MNPTLHHLALSAALAASMTLLACTGTSVGNPEDGDVTLRVEPLPAGQPAASSSQRSARAQSLTTPSGVTIDAASARIERVLTRSDSCGKGNEREAGMTLLATLIDAGEPADDTLPLDMPSGQYCQIRVELAPVDDATIRVSGTRADGEPFTITSALKRQLIFNRGQQQKLGINPGEDTLLILTMDVNAWIDADALNALPADALTITSASNASFIASFDRAVLSSIALARDTDGDGLSSAEERGDFERSDETSDGS